MPGSPMAFGFSWPAARLSRLFLGELSGTLFVIYAIKGMLALVPRRV